MLMKEVIVPAHVAGRFVSIDDEGCLAVSDPTGSRR
jgi:hypothetical protein